MSSGADVWGYITGVLSVLAVIFQLIRINLPSNKLKEFDALLQETEDLLHEADEEGLLSGGDFVHQTNESLGRLRGTALTLRSRVHMAKTISQQCLGIFTGLSVRISVLCSEVKEVRAEIATTSDKTRETLRQLGLIHNQQEAQRVALELLNEGQVSDANDGRDVSSSEDLRSSDSLNGSQSGGDEAENKTLNEAESEMANRAEEKVVTFQGDSIREVIDIVEVSSSTAILCQAT